MKKKLRLLMTSILLSISFFLIGIFPVGAQSPGPTAVITESCIDQGKICRDHDPVSGLPTDSKFLNDSGEYVYGWIGDLWFVEGEITESDDPSDFTSRQRVSGEFFGYTNPLYSCGWWPCSFWP